VVLDTNTIISGLLWKGAPHAVLALIEQGQVSPYISPPLITELREVLERPKFKPRLEAVTETSDNALGRYLQYAEVVDAPPTPPLVAARDPDDDHVLACAVAVPVDYIVSGDGHLLDLGRYEGIPILSAADFMAAYQKSITS
jgi:putative PIN family toxin of toxin-antitoxin system